MRQNHFKHINNFFYFISGNSNSNDASPCSESNIIQQHIPSQWHMSPTHQIRNMSPTNTNHISHGLGQLAPQPITQSLGGFSQNTMQHGIHSYHPQSAKSFGHQPFYGWY